MPTSLATVRVIDTASSGAELPIIEENGQARAVLWPGNGARFRSFQLISLLEGGSTRQLSHASDCVYYVIAGEGEIIDLATGEASALVEGSMVHIDAGDSYRLRSSKGAKLVGGPCPPDPELYAALATTEGAD
jgi:mannose-6-phosphate isomerase-like protein (cupin superfamily)